MKIIENQLPPTLLNNTYVAMDTEWFRMVKSRLHRPWTGKFACLTFCYRPGEVYFITDRLLAEDTIKRVDNCVWIFHNAKFDMTQLRRIVPIPPRTRLIDTMMIERILWNGYYDEFSEEDLARRYLHIHLDKSLQKRWGEVDEFTPELKEYAVGDADALLKIWLEQKKHITKTDMWIYRNIDLPTMWAVLDFRGFRLDEQGWKGLAEDNLLQAKLFEDQLDFNPRSWQQVLPKLKERGFKNLKDTQAETLEKAIEKFPNTEAAKQADLVLLSRQYSTFASRYGKKWIRDYIEAFPDGSSGFVADYYIIGAETGRMSASSPPMHQVPSRDTKVFREKFIARPGCKLIIGDYSAQEVFIMAYLSKDKRMMEVCNSGKDIYIMMAKNMYDVDITKKDPLRKRMKSVVLGIDYGMSEVGLARKEGISEAEAAKVIFQFRETFPEVSSYMDKMVREKDVVYTVSGRKCYLNRYSSQCSRNALNSPIQGTAADITKLAIVKIHQGWRWDCEFGIVNVVHDEIVLDVPEEYAEEVRAFAQEQMVAAAKEICPGLNFRADCVIGNTWADKE